MTAGETEPMRDQRNTELLLRVQMRGVVDGDAVRALYAEIGLTEADLHDLVSGSLLADDDGFLYLTDRGDQHLTEALAGQADAEDLPDLMAFAEEFDALDAQVKEAVTAWQHAAQRKDEEAQIAAVQRWLDADSRLLAAVSRSSSTSRLFGRCLTRLAAARERVLDGNIDQLAGPDDSSYHSVWFLLHEMLLRSLRRKRSRG